MIVDVTAAQRIVFFTGAGMSAESGVPTYRGRGGTWSEYDYEDYACQEAFDRDPEKVWTFHETRRRTVAACQPHRGHRRLADLQRSRPGVVVVTQNIDGLHARAGATVVHELHGSLWRVRCDACGVVMANLEVPLTTRRHACGAHLRPDIVWFGDALSPKTLATAIAAISACDLLVSIGTSAVVHPAAALPGLARQNGARLVEINPEETALSDLYDVHLRGSASLMLDRLLG